VSDFAFLAVVSIWPFLGAPFGFYLIVSITRIVPVSEEIRRPLKNPPQLPKYLTYTAARKKRKAGVLSKDPGSLRGFYIGVLYTLIKRLPTVSAVSFVAFAGFADSPI